MFASLAAYGFVNMCATLSCLLAVIAAGVARRSLLVMLFYWTYSLSRGSKAAPLSTRALHVVRQKDVSQGLSSKPKSVNQADLPLSCTWLQCSKLGHPLRFHISQVSRPYVPTLDLLIRCTAGLTAASKESDASADVPANSKICQIYTQKEPGGVCIPDCLCKTCQHRLVKLGRHCGWHVTKMLNTPHHSETASGYTGHYGAQKRPTAKQKVGGVQYLLETLLLIAGHGLGLVAPASRQLLWEGVLGASLPLQEGHAVWRC